ncbi:glycosyltransferase family 9 protein [Cetobacterium sp.]|uniref:glycosyltransferase family 9 protein n=1 Tax=Cetobacterium sp. TaxID=2071632 RepID=UPI002FC5CD7F
MKHLKKSYVQEGINLYLVRFILSFFKNRFKPQGKVLIKTCDGIGDILVRTKLIKMIEDKYGKENIYFLMQKGYTGLGEILGYKAIGYSREDRKNFIPRLKKMYELNSMGFSTYINVEFTNDITTGNLFIPERIGREDLNWQVSRNNKYYTKSYRLKDDYVMNQVAEMSKEILGKSFESTDLIPDLRELFEIKEENIVVAVGSTDRTRVCSPIIMANYLKEVKNRYPDKIIQLVGNGDRQERYAKKLIELLGEDKIENLVNKTSLKDVFERVAKSCLFIGFESGLYNFCFALRKKGIILFKAKEGAFIHRVPWLTILSPEIDRKDIIDQEYPGLKINSIEVKAFKRALEEMENEKSSY